MLVLRRRENESFVIFSGTKEIEDYVTEIDDNSVQIGIEADKDVTVFRREIVDKDNFYLPRASNQQ